MHHILEPKPAVYGPEEPARRAVPRAGDDEMSEQMQRKIDFYAEVKKKQEAHQNITPGQLSAKLKDNVNHPAHYTSGKIEVIDFIEDQQLNYHLGNALKYIARAGKKDPSKKVEDVRKAIWYLNRYVDLMLLP